MAWSPDSTIFWGVRCLAEASRVRDTNHRPTVATKRSLRQVSSLPRVFDCDDVEDGIYDLLKQAAIVCDLIKDVIPIQIVPCHITKLCSRCERCNHVRPGC